MKKILASLALLCPLFAPAKDLGVQGMVWPITELDIRQMMVESAGRTDWTAAQDELKDSAKHYLERLPKRMLGSPDKTQTAWFNPSIVLSSDIQVPVKQSDGAYTWQVLAPKGSKVNPLEKYRPLTALFFFDSANADQLKMVQEVLAREPDRIVPIEAGAGDLKVVHELLARPVFYANDAMMNRFQIRYLPSLVYPGEGAQELLLGVTSFAAPYPSDEVLRAWPALTPKVANAPKAGAK